jgi:hypothetical protein
VPGGKRGIIQDQTTHAGPGLYAFVAEGIAFYVGKTSNVVVSRLDNYRHSEQEHSREKRELILSQLKEGKQVAIYHCLVRDMLELSRLESELIGRYDLPGNRT